MNYVNQKLIVLWSPCEGHIIAYNPFDSSTFFDQQKENEDMTNFPYKISRFPRLTPQTREIAR